MAPRPHTRAILTALTVAAAVAGSAPANGSAADLRTPDARVAAQVPDGAIAPVDTPATMVAPSASEFQ